LSVLQLFTSAKEVMLSSALVCLTVLLLNSRRRSLNPSKVNKLMFLHDNFDLITTSKSVKLGRVEQTPADDPDPVAGPSWR